MEGVGFVIRTLKSWRTDDKEWTSDEFGSFSLAQQLAERNGVNITTPRLASRQNHRNNVPANIACEYFRRAVWFPYLDAIIVIQQQTKHPSTYAGLISWVVVWCGFLLGCILTV